MPAFDAAYYVMSVARCSDSVSGSMSHLLTAEFKRLERPPGEHCNYSNRTLFFMADLASVMDREFVLPTRTSRHTPAYRSTGV